MSKKDQLLQEFKLRRLIRKAIRLKQKKEKVDEQKLRKLVRNLVTEGDVDADTKPAPYTSTALSALADAFNQVLPVLKTGLRKLAKSEERQSYRAHVLQKFSNMFKNFEGLDGNRSGAIGESDINEQEEDNDITIKIDDPDRVMPSDGKENERFKPEEKPTLEPDDDDIEKLAISTENPTGARFAFNTINTSNIEKLLSDTRRLLPQEEDKQEFKEYAMYNVDLWLLTYEQELADELGVDPAFDEVVTKRPAGAQIQGAADKFAAVEEPAMEDFEEENTDDITTDLESILMME
jgi:hypothetical protein|tara:strand:- start:1552 stop:2430 length:879 start_codon:yes stop_codon:yes gene_type:complete